MIRVTLPYPPALNHLYSTVRGHRVLSREGRAYKQAVAAMLRTAPLIEGPIRVRLDVFRPRKAGDLDNTFKCLLDSLTGAAYADDKQVVEIHARRHDDKANPRVELEITPDENQSHQPDGTTINPKFVFRNGHPVSPKFAAGLVKAMDRKSALPPPALAKVEYLESVEESW